MASSNNSLDNLKNTYKNVVEDVIKNVRESFLDEGVDLQVLEELKQLWSNKIDCSRVIDRPPKILQADPIPPPSSSSSSSSSSASSSSAAASKPLPQQGSTGNSKKMPQPPPLIHQPSPESVPVIQHAPATKPPTLAPPHPSQQAPPPAPLVLGNPGGSVAGVTAAAQLPVNLMNTTVGQIATFQHGMVPVQTPQGLRFVPLQAFMSFQQATAKQQTSEPTTGQKPDESSSDNVQQIDGSAPELCTSSTLHNVFASQHTTTHNSPSLGNSIYLGGRPLVPNFTGDLSPSSCAASETRANITGVSVREMQSVCVDGLPLESREDRLASIGDAAMTGDGVRGDGVRGDSVRGGGVEALVQLDGAQAGSSEEEDSDGDDETSDEDDQPHVDDEDPLNSEDDDIDHEDKDEDFDTEDTIVCQWEKVLRVKNKWKLQLKDGVMHLGGHDYVFQKTIGEAEW